MLDVVLHNGTVLTQATPGEDTAVRGRAEGHRQARDRARRLHARPLVRREKGSAVENELQGLPAERRQGATRRDSVLPDTDARPVRDRHRCRRRARVLGVSLSGFDGMNLDPVANGRMSFTAKGDATPKPSYNFHFPDG